MKLFRLSALTLLLLLQHSVVRALDGFLEPNATINIVSPETGTISVRNVNQGDAVSAGDILVELDSGVLQASLTISKTQKNSKAQIRVAQAEYRVAKKRFNELTSLFNQKIITSEELDRAKSQFVIAESNLLRAKNERTIHALEHDRIQQQLLKRKVISPINGIVTEINRDLGELVTMNQGAFIQIVDVSYLKMVVYVPYKNSKQLKVEDIVAIQTELDQMEYPAKVQFVSPIIDPASSTVKIELKIDNKDNQLKSGIQARLVLENAAIEQRSGQLESKVQTGKISVLTK